MPSQEATDKYLEVSNAPPIYKDVSELTEFFGKFGGCYAPEPLINATQELAKEYVKASQDPEFRREFEQLGRDYIGRPTPLYFAKHLTEKIKGAQIWLKREDLAHTGAHKINNALGQALVAKRLGKHRIIAETGAGQHGVATATVCALLGMECTIYMGYVDTQRQSLNVFRMKMLGAKVVAVKSGSQTLKEAVNVAIQDWVENFEDTHYILGSAVGPHPFPTIVRDFQAVIGREAKAQLQEERQVLPDAIVACVGGGSNAIGLFNAFLEDKSVAIYGVEGAGDGVDTDRNAATMTLGRPGLFHGTKTYLLMDDQDNVLDTHSISAGLDYAGVGPQHSYLKDSGRVTYVPCTDAQALDAFQQLSKYEGIIPALESSHAVWYGIELAAKMEPNQVVLINVSGRGDKDMIQVAEKLGVNLNDDMTD